MSSLLLSLSMLTVHRALHVPSISNKIPTVENSYEHAKGCANAKPSLSNSEPIGPSTALIMARVAPCLCRMIEHVDLVNRVWMLTVLN